MSSKVHQQVVEIFRRRAVATVRDERGATAVEYGLMVALIAAVIIAVVALLGEEVAAAFQNFIDSTPW